MLDLIPLLEIGVGLQLRRASRRRSVEEPDCGTAPEKAPGVSSGPGGAAPLGAPIRLMSMDRRSMSGRSARRSIQRCPGQRDGDFRAAEPDGDQGPYERSRSVIGLGPIVGARPLLFRHEIAPIFVEPALAGGVDKFPIPVPRHKARDRAATSRVDANTVQVRLEDNCTVGIGLGGRAGKVGRWGVIVDRFDAVRSVADCGHSRPEQHRRRIETLAARVVRDACHRGCPSGRTARCGGCSSRRELARSQELARNLLTGGIQYPARRVPMSEAQLTSLPLSLRCHSIEYAQPLRPQRNGGRPVRLERVSAEEPMIAALISSVSMVSEATWNAQAWRPVRGWR